MTVIFHSIIDWQRFFTDVTLGCSFKLLNLSHCQSFHELFIPENFFEVLGKFLQFLHEPFCRLRPPKATILGQRVVVTTLQVVPYTECFMLLLSIFISRRFQQTLKIRVDNEWYSLSLSLLARLSKRRILFFDVGMLTLHLLAFFQSFSCATNFPSLWK